MRLKEALELLGFKASEADAALFTGGRRAGLPRGLGRRHPHCGAGGGARCEGEGAPCVEVRPWGGDVLPWNGAMRDRAARTSKLAQRKLTGELLGRYSLTDAPALFGIGCADIYKRAA